VTVPKLYKPGITPFFSSSCGNQASTVSQRCSTVRCSDPVLHAGFLSVKPGSDQVWAFSVPFARCSTVFRSGGGSVVQYIYHASCLLHVHYATITRYGNLNALLSFLRLLSLKRAFAASAVEVTSKLSLSAGSTHPFTSKRRAHA